MFHATFLFPLTREDNVLVELRPHVHLGRLDGREDELGDALALDIDQMRLERTT